MPKLLPSLLVGSHGFLGERGSCDLQHHAELTEDERALVLTPAWREHLVFG
jgi:hypothetical protein